MTQSTTSSPGMPSTEDRLKILYIGGYGRSGSTLLDRLLGEVDGFVSVGEMRHIWTRSFGRNGLCGCGVDFRACTFWRAVVERSLGDVHRIDAPALIALKRSVDRMKYIPVMPWRHALRAYSIRFERYAAILVRLYTAIRQVSGSRVIIDSSKDPSHAMLLCLVPEFDVHLVHLVRDSRAVAYSWQRRKSMPGSPDGNMPRYHPAVSAIRWNLYNYPFGLIRRHARRYTLLRYEDFIGDPASTLSSLLNFVGEAGSAVPSISADGEVRLGRAHIVAGNPIRFHTGPLRLRADEEWRERLPARSQRLVGLLTRHLMRRYGYR